MRRRAAATVAVAVVALASRLGAIDRLDACRTAVAGGRSLPPIRALKMTGRLRAAADRDAISDGIVEIRIQWPRRYIRVDTIGGARHVSGFDGDHVLTAGRGRSAERLRFERGQLSRLMLGIAGMLAEDDRVEI